MVSGQADGNGLPRHQIPIAFATDPMRGHVAHEDVDPAVARVKHMCLEQPSLACIRALLLNSGIVIHLHF